MFSYLLREVRADEKFLQKQALRGSGGVIVSGRIDVGCDILYITFTSLCSRYIRYLVDWNYSVLPCYPLMLEVLRWCFLENKKVNLPISATAVLE